MIIKFTYRNHRERIDERHVVPKSISFEPDPPSEYKYSPGWFLKTHDIDKNEPRTFAFTNIIPTRDQRVLVDFTKLVEKEATEQLVLAVDGLIKSIKHDEYGSPIGRFQDGNGGLLSKKTHAAAALVERLLEYYK